MDQFIPSIGFSPAGLAIIILSLVTVLIDTPSLVWYIKNPNLAATCLSLWIIIENLKNFVNALLWPDDNIPTWFQGHYLCDIEVNLELAAHVGLLGALL